MGQPVQATLGIEVDGQPSSEAQVDYFISDKDGKVVVRGTAQPADAGTFVINIPGEETSRLSAGPNQLKIFANSNFAFSPDVSTTTILASSTDSAGGQAGGNHTNGTTPESTPSGCLIATAAFGSELTPQVQYLRSFRQDYILSTVSGSAFMNAFNSVYYSFSPQVADYERDQPWLQATVKTTIYPLFGILTVSEKAHFAASGGEAGAVAAGAVASSLIGAVYLCGNENRAASACRRRRCNSDRNHACRPGRADDWHVAVCACGRKRSCNGRWQAGQKGVRAGIQIPLIETACHCLPSWVDSTGSYWSAP
jgi:peptide/nickel transport system substrate-binding protein